MPLIPEQPFGYDFCTLVLKVWDSRVVVVSDNEGRNDKGRCILSNDNGEKPDNKHISREYPVGKHQVVERSNNARALSSSIAPLP